jgi:hypothetical protein
MFWVAGGIGISEKVHIHAHPYFHTWAIASFLFWGLAGCYILGKSIWYLTGSELVVIDPKAITIRRSLPIGHWSRTFDVHAITGLTHEPPSFNWAPLRMSADIDSESSLAGSVVFMCGRRRQRFGLGIDWADMAELLKAVRERVGSGAVRQEPK